MLNPKPTHPSYHDRRDKLRIDEYYEWRGCLTKCVNDHEWRKKFPVMAKLSEHFKEPEKNRPKD